MSGILFSLDLERVVTRSADIIVIRDRCEHPIRSGDVRSTRSATERVSRNRIGSTCTSGWRTYIFIEPVHQNVRTARSGISGGQDNLPGQLLFNIDIKLLNHTLLEIEIL